MNRTELHKYMSPICSIVEIENEGILCGSDFSGGFDHDGIGGNDDDIFNF